MSSKSAVELGTLVISEALKRAGVPASEVDMVYMGCVIQAALGQNVARQCALKAVEAGKYDCIIVDEAQFLTKEQVETFAYICDMYDVPVICYGLKTDFQGNFFEGSHWLLARADAIEEVKTICWCGKKATQNARLDGKGGITKEGDQVVLGANDTYIGLCRKHWRLGDPGPGLRAEDLKRKAEEKN